MEENNVAILGEEHKVDLIKPFVPSVEEIEDVKNTLSKAKAENTRKAYRTDKKKYEEWCHGRNVRSYPCSEEQLKYYINFLKAKGLKYSTIQRRCNSLSQLHRAAQLNNPTLGYEFRSYMEGVRNELTTAVTGKEPLLGKDLSRILEIIPSELRGTRDKAILLTGWYSAMRRSEIVALDLDDLVFTDEGVTINIRKSKTNQSGDIEKVAICFQSNPNNCPVNSLKEWISVAQITSGALFMSIDKKTNQIIGRLSHISISRLVKKYVKKIGLEDSRYGGHSLRSGFMTQGALQGIEERVLMKQSRHKSIEVARRYIKEGSLFTNNATKQMNLQ